MIWLFNHDLINSFMLFSRDSVGSRFNFLYAVSSFNKVSICSWYSLLSIITWPLSALVTNKLSLCLRNFLHSFNWLRMNLSVWLMCLSVFKNLVHTLLMELRVMSATFWSNLMLKFSKLLMIPTTESTRFFTFFFV